jgi:hypothetical protein
MSRGRGTGTGIFRFPGLLGGIGISRFAGSFGFGSIGGGGGAVDDGFGFPPWLLAGGFLLSQGIRGGETRGRIDGDAHLGMGMELQLGRGRAGLRTGTRWTGEAGGGRLGWRVTSSSCLVLVAQEVCGRHVDDEVAFQYFINHGVVKVVVVVIMMRSWW